MRHRKRYRWFIRARPDIAYRHSLPPLEAWPTRGEHWAALEANDVFGIMTRGPARALFQTLPTKLLEECATGAVDNGQLFLQSLRSYRLAVPHVIPARNNQAATGITIVRPCHVERVRRWAIPSSVYAWRRLERRSPDTFRWSDWGYCGSSVGLRGCCRPRPLGANQTTKAVAENITTRLRLRSRRRQRSDCI